MVVKFITKDGRKIPIKIVTGEIHSSPRMIKKEKQLQHHRAKSLKDFKKKQLIQENEKENVEESIAHIVRIFPEGIVSIKNEGKPEFSRDEANPVYRVEMDGGIFTGDIENLKKKGIDITSIHGTKDGNIEFTVEIPKNLRQTSPKKENKIEFAMKNLDQPHMKQGMREIASSNIDETEQELLKNYKTFDTKSGRLVTKKGLTDKQLKRMNEIERMANPHQIGNAPSPREDRT